MSYIALHLKFHIWKKERGLTRSAFLVKVAEAFV